MSLSGQYVMYQSEAMLDEKRKVLERQEREDFKRQAFIDAQQWKMFTDDKRGDLMFISTIHGELRAGEDLVLDDHAFNIPPHRAAERWRLGGAG